MSSKNVFGNDSSPKAYNGSSDVAAVLARMLQGTGAGTQTELAALLEIGKAAISDAKRRSIVPADWYLKLCRPPFYLNPLWLESGVGAMQLPSAAAENTGGGMAEGMAAYGEAVPETHQSVPLARPRPAGDGGLEQGEPARQFLFLRAWLEERGTPERMKLLRIMGEAMHPTLRDGDLVLLDEAQQDIHEGNIYVLRMDGQIVVKRLAKRPGSILLISENRALYEPLDVPYPSAGLAVIGRVVWFSREI